MKNIVVTGGAGFIGSNFAIKALSLGHKVVVIDKLTYAGSLQNLSTVEGHKNLTFIKDDINNYHLVRSILKEHKIDWLINFAAESHVDNSINDPEDCIKTNICGVYTLLRAATDYYHSSESNKSFRFLQISTDEVFGSIEEGLFNEQSRYSPNSPYSASKASADHLVNAWHETYGLPTIITNCSNNFGPRQHLEKFVPKVIYNAINGLRIPVYGNGLNVRDWIYVDNHCEGIILALNKGRAGQSYCFGGSCEINNITLAKKICHILDHLEPCSSPAKSYFEQIEYVKDRPGHDKRYAIDNAKSIKELGFVIDTKFDENLEKTIQRFLNVYLDAKTVTSYG